MIPTPEQAVSPFELPVASSLGSDDLFPFLRTSGFGARADRKVMSDSLFCKAIELSASGTLDVSDIEGDLSAHCINTSLINVTVSGHLPAGRTITLDADLNARLVSIEYKVNTYCQIIPGAPPTTLRSTGDAWILEAPEWDLVIDSNEKVEKWATMSQSISGFPYRRVLVKAGTWGPSVGIDLTVSGTVYVKGEVGNIITKGLTYGTTSPRDPEYVIENINIDSGSFGYGFADCNILKNCSVSINRETSQGGAVGFSGCRSLINCESTCASSFTAYDIVGFQACTNLIHCKGTASAAGSNTASGFRNCVNLINCVGSAQSVTGTGFGFLDCENIYGCDGTSADYGFDFLCIGLDGNCSGISQGGDAFAGGPANVHRKMFRSTTAANAGETKSIATGLDPLKIISVTGGYRYANNAFIPFGRVSVDGTLTALVIALVGSDGYLSIRNSDTATSDVVQKPLIAIVEYYE